MSFFKNRDSTSLPKDIKWFLSYDDNDYIRELYNEYNIVADDFKYCDMKSKKT